MVQVGVYDSLFGRVVLIEIHVWTQVARSLIVGQSTSPPFPRSGRSAPSPRPEQAGAGGWMDPGSCSPDLQCCPLIPQNKSALFSHWPVWGRPDMKQICNHVCTRDKPVLFLWGGPLPHSGVDSSRANISDVWPIHCGGELMLFAVLECSWTGSENPLLGRFG